MLKIKTFELSDRQIHTPSPCTAIDEAPNTFEERRFKPFAGLPPRYRRFVFRARKASFRSVCRPDFFYFSKLGPHSAAKALPLPSFF